MEEREKTDTGYCIELGLNQIEGQSRSVMRKVIQSETSTIHDIVS